MVETGRETVRRTPFELVFVDGGHEAELLPAIAREADSRGVDVTLPERMLLLESAGQLLRSLRPDVEPGGAGAEYGALLFHGFHFWRAGRPLFVIEPAALRALLTEPTPAGNWVLEAPRPSGYLQLPRHLVWVPGDEEGAPEPADGFFWTFAPLVGGGAGRRLLLALVLGLRPGRPGFAAIAIDAAVPPPPAAHWADVRAREAGRDFANILPGGEIEGLFAFTSVAEALRFASLVFRFAASPAGMPGDEEQPDGGSSGSPHVPPPTALPFRRIPRGAHG